MNRTYILLVACFLPISVGAQVPRDSVTSLALRWAPRWARVSCGDRGPRGEFVRPPQLYCGWQVNPPEVLGVYVSSAAPGVSMVTWERRLKTRSDAQRFVDSLGVGLLAAGYIDQRCVAHAASGAEVLSMLWETKAVVVYVLQSVTEIGAKVVTMATVPAGVPALARRRCRGSA
jgi:hypothetical protein